MNAARISKSARLQRVWNLLSTGGWHSTREIICKAHVCAVNSIAAELKANGKNIECQRRGDVWYYRRAKRAKKA